MERNLVSAHHNGEATHVHAFAADSRVRSARGRHSPFGRRGTLQSARGGEMQWSWLRTAAVAVLLPSSLWLGTQSVPAWRSPAGRRGRLAAAAITVAAALLLHKNFAVLSAAVALLLLGKRLVCVGLTGGIAAGKSAVADELQQQGAVIIDADVVARDVVEPGTPALAKLVSHFGETILNEDGTLNRKRLREIMIDDRSARRFINGVTHPAIAWETLKRVATHRWLGGKLVVIDAALLFESGLFLQLLCSPIICVTAPTPLRIERIIARDHVSAVDAAGMIAAQMPQDRKAALSHITIENAGTAEQLRQRVREVVQLL